MPVLQDRAVLVAYPVEGREDVGSKTAGFLQNGPDIIGAEVAIQAIGEGAAHAGGMGEGEGDVVHRRAKGHALLPEPPLFMLLSGLVQRIHRVNDLGQGAEKLIARADMVRVRPPKRSGRESMAGAAAALLTAWGVAKW
jgi:hypothetical protein